jgi:hypothetical protein
MNVWIYRPDIEAQARKLNMNFVYNGNGTSYFDVLDKRNEIKRQIDEILEKRHHQPKTKMEVPCE